MSDSAAAASILIVEDETFIALLIQHELESLGHTILDTTTTVTASLQQLDRMSPDLVMLDYNLGRETSEAVAMRLNARAIPYLLCTAQADQAAGISAFAPAGYLSKPIDIIRLRQLTARALASTYAMRGSAAA